jgi:hypothetical protein
MKRLILFSIVIVLLCAGFIGYHMYQKQVPDVTNQKPVLFISSNELIAAFDRDSSSASKKYFDKVIAVSGILKHIDTAGAIALGNADEVSEVVAGFDTRHLGELKNLHTGTPITIQGVCSGFSKAGNDDLLAALGTTVQLRSAGLKKLIVKK